MKTMDLMEAIGQVGDDMKMEVVSEMMYEINGKSRKRGKLGRTLLIAAVITTLLGATAYAIAANIMNLRNVKDEKISGRWGEQFITVNNANLELSFDVGLDSCPAAVFRPDWLPAEPERPVQFNRYEEESGEGWYTMYADDGADPGGELPYNIQISSAANLKGMKLYFSGDMEIVKQDEWKGWQRTEIHGDYRRTSPEGVECMLDRYYILLFNEKNCVYVYLATTEYDLETLEKIAENLEIRVLDCFIETSSDKEGHVGYIDLGRG